MTTVLTVLVLVAAYAAIAGSGDGPRLSAEGPAATLPGQIDPGLVRLDPVRETDEATTRRGPRRFEYGALEVELTGQPPTDVETVVAVLDAKTGVVRRRHRLDRPTPGTLAFEKLPSGPLWIAYADAATSLRHAYFQRVTAEITTAGRARVTLDLTLHTLQLELAPSPTDSESGDVVAKVPITPLLRRTDDPGWMQTPPTGNDPNARANHRFTLAIPRLGAGEYELEILGFEPREAGAIRVRLPGSQPPIIGRFR